MNGLASSVLPAVSGGVQPEQDIEVKLLHAAYKRKPLNLLLTVAVVLIGGSLLRLTLPSALMSIWSAAILASAVVGYVEYTLFQRTVLIPRVLARWQSVFMVQSIGSGAAWALGPTLMLPDATGAQSTLLVVALLCVCAVAITSMAEQQGAMQGFIATALAPAAAVEWFTGGRVEQMVALSLLCGLALMIVVGRDSNQATRTLLQTQTRLRQAGAEASAARARYFDLYDLAPVGYCAVSEEGMILEANLTAAALLGSDRSALVRQPIVRYLFPEDQPTFTRLSGQLLDTGEPQESEVRMLRKGSAQFWAHLVATAVRDEGGASVMRIVLSDITPRKQAEAALRASEHFARAIANSVPGQVSYWTPELRCAFANQEYIDWFGRTAEQIQGLRMEELLGDELFQKNEPWVRAALQGNDQRFERTVIKANGETGYAWVQYIAHRQESNVLGFFVVVTDITPVKQGQHEQLRVSDVALKAISQGVIIAGPDECILSVNDAFVRCTGYNGTELIGRTCRCFLGPLTSPTAVAAIHLALNQASQFAGEVLCYRKDQTTFWSELTISPSRDERGELTHFIAVINDITERKQSEENKSKLEVQLQRAMKVESIGRLAGGVAHDFNNMLGVILGHAELALSQLNPWQPLHANLLDIQAAATRSAHLTRQLLAFAREQTVAPKVLNLNETVRGLLTMLPRLLGEQIHVTWQPGDNLWSVKIDPSQIEQILTNLCVNARDAIVDIGRIGIETANCGIDADFCVRCADAEPGDYVRLKVSDTGVGMESEVLAQIFEPFFTTKGIGVGTGLGLATVYGNVRQNNGFITVSSQRGRGTVFEIYLPRFLGQEEPQRTAVEVPPVQRGKETILLIEDEAAVLKLTRRLLEAQGYVVLGAGNPGEAIRLAREHAEKIHLLLTDVVMPEMNGRDLARTLMADYPQLKRMFMSGYTADVIARHGVLEEGVCFIQKPFSINELAAKVRAALDCA